MPIDQREALAVIAANRGERIVIPTMGAISLWPGLSDGPLDFSYMPSSMGQVTGLALGLALAQPDHGVIALCGDGSLLMNLGSMVTIAQHPADVWLVLLDNGQYEITGGQPVAGAGRTDFAGLARSTGWQRVYTFDDLTNWQASAAEVFSGRGPVFVWLKLLPQPNQKTPTPPHPMPAMIVRLQDALGVARAGRAK
jgi:thiamine pyrophosphate-dependent acetolactate synthase large subunit-like protein